MRQLPDFSGRSLLDVGAWDGYYSFLALDTTDFWRPDLLGRRSFDFARAALASNVEPVFADFTTVELDSLGSFDVACTSACCTT